MAYLSFVSQRTLFEYFLVRQLALLTFRNICSKLTAKKRRITMQRISIMSFAFLRLGLYDSGVSILRRTEPIVKYR